MLFFRKKKKRDEKLEQRKQEILSKIRPILSDLLELNAEKIVPNAKIAEDLGVDSLDSVEITIKLEDVFNIEISDDDIEKMKTVDDILTYLARNEES